MTRIQLSGDALTRLKAFCNTHEVTVRRYTATVGAAGGAIRTARNDGIKKCRIVPVMAREALELRQAGIQITHRVYFSSNPSLDVDYCLEYGTRKLWVKAVRNPDELSQFWIIDCEERQHADGG